MKLIIIASLFCLCTFSLKAQLVEKDSVRNKISSIDFKIKKSKGLFAISGAGLIAGSLLGYNETTLKPPTTNSKDYKKELELFENQKKGVSNASKFCYLLSGFSLIAIAIKF